MDLYFKRHDGQAVTCEDFFAAMRDANNADFANFLLWLVFWVFFSSIVMLISYLTDQLFTGTLKLGLLLLK
jgi:hypothetical protein